MKFFDNAIKFVKAAAEFVTEKPEPEVPFDLEGFKFNPVRDREADRLAALRKLETSTDCETKPRTTPLPTGLEDELVEVFGKYESIELGRGYITSATLELDFSFDDSEYRAALVLLIGETELHGWIFFDRSPQAPGCVWEYLEGGNDPRTGSDFYESIWHFILERDNRLEAELL